MGRNKKAPVEIPFKYSLNFMQIKFVVLEKFSIFAVPKGERRSEGLTNENKRLGSSKNFKILLKTFGQFKIKFYFCTRKYGKAQRQKRVAGEA